MLLTVAFIVSAFIPAILGSVWFQDGRGSPMKAGIFLVASVLGPLVASLSLMRLIRRGWLRGLVFITVAAGLFLVNWTVAVLSSCSKL